MHPWIRRGIFGLSLALVIISLVLTIEFWYYREHNNYDQWRTGVCQVMSCVNFTSICNDQLCTLIQINYTLLNGTILTSARNQANITSFAPNIQLCPPINLSIPCYYNHLDISATLTLSQPDNESSDAIMMMVFIIFVFFMILAIGLTIESRKYCQSRCSDGH
jgi:hypothetical protein